MKSKVLLMYVPGIEIGYGPIFPLGIGYLYSYLKQDRDVLTLNYERMDNLFADLTNHLISFKPDIIGMTCTTFNRGNVRKVCLWLKQYCPNVKIILGGVHASFFPQQMIDYYKADFVVIGEGEQALRRLCNNIDEGQYDEGESYIIEGFKTKHLDDLFYPEFTYGKEIMINSGLGFVITSRGCPANCVFCSTSEYWGQKVRKYSPSRVVDEIQIMIHEYGVKKILFHDDTFNLGIDRTIAICDEIKKRNVKVDWSCCCRVHPISTLMIEEMIIAGCKHICWGVESGSKQILERLNKNITQEQIKNAFDICEKYIGDISVGTFSMVGNPGETDETIKESYNFFNTLSLTDSPAPSALYVLPGTQVYRKMLKRNPKLDDFWIHNEGMLRYDEYPQEKLSEWVRIIGSSGNIKPFDRNKHFLKGVLF